jgi:16S rRNA (cytosine967-C5)-methyltransferase
MTPAARVQAAIEVLDQVIEAANRQGAPADRLLAEWFRTHRFAGSSDKRAIREHVYAAIRACGPVPESGRAAMLLLGGRDPALLALFDGSTPHAPAPPVAGEQVATGGIAPHWLEERLAASGIAGDEAAALLDRAPLDVRVNTLKATRDTLALPIVGEPLAAAQAVRLPSGTNVEQWDAWLDGLIEVQDLGSQLACRAVGAQPGETVIDLCAGAGGKTLALAAAMQGQGTLIAADTDRGRLSRLTPRAARAGADMIKTVLLDPGRELDSLASWQGKADRVLIDAPCSGTGTWRRNPEARWRLTPRELDRLTELQARLLDIAVALVRPGGTLIYVTCSLLDEEGAGQAQGFLDTHSGWRAVAPELPLGAPRGPGLRLSPARDGTDGFFIASLVSP